jgi:hypothetical protein
MGNDLDYSDEEIHRLLRHIKAEQKLVPASDEALAEAKSEETPARPASIARELSIEEILKRVERDILDKKEAAAVNRR